MMTIKFKTGGEAFRDVWSGELTSDDQARECIRILDGIKTQLDHGYREGICMDYNGNKVGEWSLK